MGPCARRIGHERYFVTFTDVYTRNTTVAFLKEKSQVPAEWEKYVALVKRQTKHRIQTLRCDNGGEYTNSTIKDFCASKGIKIEYTAPYSPAQNGIAEWLNGILEEKASLPVPCRSSCGLT